jgi:hypothetical protein
MTTLCDQPKNSPASTIDKTFVKDQFRHATAIATRCSESPLLGNEALPTSRPTTVPYVPIACRLNAAVTYQVVSRLLWRRRRTALYDGLIHATDQAQQVATVKMPVCGTSKFDNDGDASSAPERSGRARPVAAENGTKYHR